MNTHAYYNGFVSRCVERGLTKQAADALYKQAAGPGLGMGLLGSAAKAVLRPAKAVLRPAKAVLRPIGRYAQLMMGGSKKILDTAREGMWWMGDADKRLTMGDALRRSFSNRYYDMARQPQHISWVKRYSTNAGRVRDGENELRKVLAARGLTGAAALGGGAYLYDAASDRYE